MKSTHTTLKVEICYAVPEKQMILPLNVPAGTTAQQAILMSDILQYFPEIQTDNYSLGIFSKKITSSYVLRDGDRVEIYRPLVADPKDRRRQSVLSDRS